MFSTPATLRRDHRHQQRRDAGDNDRPEHSSRLNRAVAPTVQAKFRPGCASRPWAFAIRRNCRMFSAAASQGALEAGRRALPRAFITSSDTLRGMCGASHPNAAHTCEGRDRRGARTSAIDPRLRHAQHHQRDAARLQSLRYSSPAAALENPHHRTTLFSGYSTMPCRISFLEPRNHLPTPAILRSPYSLRAILVAQR